MKVKDLIALLNYSCRDYRKPSQFIKFHVGPDGFDCSSTMESNNPHVKEWEDREVKEIWLTYNYGIDEPVLNIEVI